MSVLAPHVGAHQLVRPAEKGATAAAVHPALMRRTVDALCELAAAAGKPMRRKVARAYVVTRLAGGDDPAEVLRGARNDLGVVDETGETARRNVDRERSGRGGAR